MLLDIFVRDWDGAAQHEDRLVDAFVLRKHWGDFPIDPMFRPLLTEQTVVMGMQAGYSDVPV